MLKFVKFLRLMIRTDSIVRDVTLIATFRY